ncbi:hypothetical protein ONZ45_g13604 [Pleurotus djamor]|nr:hypothetical protein ONZ45_g13604 [Pleurotus djamor]
MPTLGLPPVPTDLKSIAPYLQRADELVSKEPIIAYWCTYHAAQLGISLKAKDPQSRNFLFELLGTLENMKKDIGPNDAIDIEAASAAYVENFGLRIFAVADNEDRRGAATRSTAKKFLAASNFLEVLRVFPKTEIADSIEDKIKYAKWKAVDITKAFREGRQPTPGPPGQPQVESSPEPPSLPEPPSVHPPTSSLASPPPSPGKPLGLGPSIHRVSPPPRMSPDDIAKANLPHTPPKSSSHLGGFGTPNQGEATPDTWSTAATPGNDISPGRDADDTANIIPSIPTIPNPIQDDRQRRGSASSNRSHHRNTSSLGGTDDEALRSLRSFPGVHDADPHKAVRFTPGAAFDSPVTPQHHLPDLPNHPTHQVHDSAIDLSLAPTNIGGPVIPPPPPPFQVHADPASPTVYRRPVNLDATAASPPSILQSFAAPTVVPQLSPPQQPYPPPPSAAAAPTPIIPAPVELTPSVIAKAQKHCRFAISALDYEDADQARKDLLTALATLGVRFPGS